MSKEHPNHSKSKEEKAAKQAAKRLRRQTQIDAKNAAEAAAKANTPANENTPAKPLAIQKSMIAEAVENAKIEAEKAANTKPVVKSAKEAAQVFATNEIHSDNVPSPTPICDAAVKDVQERFKAHLEAQKTDTDEEIKVDPALEDGRTMTEHGKEADEAEKADSDNGDTEEKAEEAAATEAPTEEAESIEASEKPLSKNKQKKLARREKRRARQEAARNKLEETQANEGMGGLVIPVKEVTNEPEVNPVLEADDQTRPEEQTTPAVETPPSETPVVETPQETTAETTAVEDAVDQPVKDANKIPWHLRTEYDKMPKLLPPPKMVTPEEIAAAEGKADETAEKPKLTVVVDYTAAKAFYGKSFNDERAETLAAALFWLDKAIEKEAIEGDIAKRHADLALKTALKKEAEAFNQRLAKAA